MLLGCSGFCDRHIRPVLLVGLKHRFIVHFVNMIAGQDQNVFRMVTLHIGKILINCIGRPGVPLSILDLFIGREHRNTAEILVKIPGNTDPDMGIESEGHVLSEDTHRVDPGIDAVTQRKIYNSVLAAKRYSRLCHIRCQDAQPASLSASQQHGDHFFFYNHLNPSSPVSSASLRKYI